MYCGSRCRYRCRCRFIFGKDERRGDGFSEFELVGFFSKVISKWRADDGENMQKEDDDAHPTYICTGFSTCAYASFYVGIFLLSTQVYRMHRLFFSYINE